MKQEIPEDITKRPFEELVSELETILKKLESGNLPLQESIELYERGTILLKVCYQMLGELEGKVVKLVRDAEGVLREIPFETGEEEIGRRS
ncbi:MAG: exodeoxyribonuclease VII small subunit [Candidatus Brocadiia bacterium]